jgi:hypothetical protein
VDPRAFLVDPERRFRVLAALIEEYVVSCAVFGAGGLSRFFDADAFLTVLDERTPLAFAFGAWLEPSVGDVAVLERAVARARRRRAAAAVVARGTLDHWSAARAQLTAEAVARGARYQRAPTSTEREHLLVHDGSIAHASEEVCALVQFAEQPRSREELIERARALGAGGDAADVVDELVRDGVLHAASPR